MTDPPSQVIPSKEQHEVADDELVGNPHLLYRQLTTPQSPEPRDALEHKSHDSTTAVGDVQDDPPLTADAVK